jgi:hypothetical protein
VRCGMEKRSSTYGDLQMYEWVASCFYTFESCQEHTFIEYLPFDYYQSHIGVTFTRFHSSPLNMCLFKHLGPHATPHIIVDGDEVQVA